MNSTSSLQFQEDLKQLIQTYLQVQIASGILLIAISLVTIVGNGLLLLAIWKNPFKTFRTPTSFFVIGLAVADFLTGVAVCPIQVLKHIGYYLGVKNRDSSMSSSLVKAGQIAQYISTTTMNSSYIILLLFTWSQFTAISFPHKHKIFVTKKRVITSVILTWVYTTTFAVLSAIGPVRVEKVLFKVDLYFHTTGSLVFLMFAYFCLYKAFKNQMRRLRSLKANSFGDQQRGRGKNRRERQFTIVNLLLLTFVIFCTLPITIVYYMYLNWEFKTQLEFLKFQLASLLSTNVLFLKFALDPLLYAWRLSQYRRALKSLFVCGRMNRIDDALSLTLDNQTAASCRRKAFSPSAVEIGHGLTAFGRKDRGSDEKWKFFFNH